jgi:hypothetical protein
LAVNVEKISPATLPGKLATAEWAPLPQFVNLADKGATYESRTVAGPALAVSSVSFYSTQGIFFAIPSSSLKGKTLAAGIAAITTIGIVGGFTVSRDADN